MDVLQFFLSNVSLAALSDSKDLAYFGAGLYFCNYFKYTYATSPALLISPAGDVAGNKKALEALNELLPTFAVIDDGIKDNEKLCLLVERGNFWGMGYLSSTLEITSAAELKNYLQPYADNDTIRNSIYSFVESNPEKRMALLL